MIQMRPVMISANGTRVPMFAAVAGDVFKPGLSGTVRLGQAPEEWYRRAKASVSKFEEIGRAHV